MWVCPGPGGSLSICVCLHTQRAEICTPPGCRGLWVPSFQGACEDLGWLWAQQDCSFCRFLAAAPSLSELDVVPNHGIQMCSCSYLLFFKGDLAQYQTNKKKKLRGRVELLLATYRPLVLFILFRFILKCDNLPCSYMKQKDEISPDSSAELLPVWNLLCLY